MQEIILPTIPIGATEINGLTSVWRDEDQSDLAGSIRRVLDE